MKATKGLLTDISLLSERFPHTTIPTIYREVALYVHDELTCTINPIVRVDVQLAIALLIL